MSATAERVSLEFHEYAALVFEDTRNAARSPLMWAKFDAETRQAYAAWTASAPNEAGCDFAAEDLQLLVLRALTGDCAYCGSLLGLENWAVVADVPPARGGRGLYRQANVAVCCARCGRAKGRFSGAEWTDIVATLNGCEDTAAADAMERLIFGGLALAGDAPRGAARRAPRVLLTPRRSRVTREVGPRGRRRRKK